jgi:hypothetical protein
MSPSSSWKLRLPDRRPDERSGILIQNRRLSLISSSTPTNPSWGRTRTNTTSEIQTLEYFWLVYTNGRTYRLSNSRVETLRPAETRNTGTLFPSADTPWGSPSLPGYGNDWYALPGCGEQLPLSQRSEYPSLCHEFLVCSDFGHDASVQHDDLVRILDGR